MYKLCLNIYGRVQGVGFRFFVRNIAQKLKILGFVKNKEDGSVYIEAVGDKEKLKEFLDKCKIGPLFSRVENIEEKWIEIDSCEFNNFEIL